MGKRRRTLRIVGRKAERRQIGSGRLRRDVMDLIGPEIAADPPVWLNSVLTVLEERFTPRRPSVEDQIHFMLSLLTLVQPETPPNVPQTIDEAMVYLGDPLGLVFQKKPALTFFTDSPKAGESTCICSYCDRVIHDEPVMRFFDRGSEATTEARLHPYCFEEAAKFDLIPDL